MASQNPKDKDPVALQGLKDQDNSTRNGLSLIPSSKAFLQDKIVSMLFESLAEGVIITDSSGRVVRINKRTEELFNYSRDTIVGKPLDMLMPEESIDKHTGHVKEFFTNPRNRPMGVELDLYGRRKGGEIFPVEVSLSCVETGDGLLAIAFITDISRRKEVEKALEQRNDELDAFAHMVAHDLNASLTTVIGYSEMLLEFFDSLSEEEKLDYIESVTRNGRKMENIINELLLFATVRQGDEPHFPLDMTEIIGEVVNRLSYELEQTKAEIVQPDSFPNAMGYAPWIEEVWFNYIRNAITYGGSPPQIELGFTKQDDGLIQFWVKDNGTGIDAERIENVFTSFSDKKIPTIKGHGFGLSIVKRIVEKLGGNVGIESQLGKGSKLYFTLPLLEAD